MPNLYSSVALILSLMVGPNVSQAAEVITPEYEEPKVVFDFFLKTHSTLHQHSTGCVQPLVRCMMSLITWPQK